MRKSIEKEQKTSAALAFLCEMKYECALMFNVNLYLDGDVIR